MTRFLILALCSLSFLSEAQASGYSGYHDLYGRYQQAVPPRRTETMEEAALRMEKERVYKESQAALEKQKRMDALALKGETMVVFVERLLLAYKGNTIVGKTRQAFINHMTKALLELLEEIDPYHPFQKDLRGIKTDFMQRTEAAPLTLAENLKKLALQGEMEASYDRGERVTPPTQAQFEEIAGNEKYWPHYLFYIVQEIEATQGKCRATRVKCLDDMTRRAGAFARDMDIKKKDAPHVGVLARQILDLVDEAFALEQQLNPTEKAHLYAVAINLLEGYLAHGSREVYLTKLRVAFQEQPDLKEIYAYLKGLSEQVEEDDVLPKRVNKSYLTPWPEVKTEADRRKEKAEKKAKKEVHKKEEEKDDGTKKMADNLKKQGFGAVEGLVEKLFKGLGG